MLGVSAAECLVIEDAPAGVLAGKAAGCRVIAFDTTMPEAELREAGADWLAKDCSGISVISAERKSGIRLSLGPGDESQGAQICERSSQR